jgi:hypothetical protein
MAFEVCVVMAEAARKFELSAKKVKNYFLLFQLVDFHELNGIHNQRYCHLVASTMAILSFRAMCRYTDVNRLK